MKMKGDIKFLCFNLETSATVYGWIALSLSVMGIIFATVALTTTEIDNDDTLQYIEENYYITKEGFCYMILASCFMTLATSAFIIIAVAKRNRYFLLPWMVLIAIKLIGATIVLVPMILPAIITAAPFALVYYIWYCVYALFSVFREEQMEKITKSVIADISSVETPYSIYKQ